ncbi:hypothetical protein CC80DRAFT_533443 [Byssothecium circinans]|uniref:Uncharacterized protein n=1 Tax=Byssothecium circinans TaxID=147558 RepID=A0A6A5U5M3_9PLEO|nr:hypothetical protein CC80DRAFT_533443 [Byssothecium circinans]
MNDDKVASITSAHISHTSALTVHKYLVTIYQSLALALEFLRGFKDADWSLPEPIAPLPNAKSRLRFAPQPSQIDQDIIVARHLALTATLRKLVGLECYPKDGVAWAELKMLQEEAQGISEWFTKNHGLEVEIEEGRERLEEMKELEAVWDWYVEVFEPAVFGLIEVLREALCDDMRWKTVGREKPLPSLPINPDVSQNRDAPSVFPRADLSRPPSWRARFTGAHCSPAPIHRASCATTACTSTVRPMLKALLSRRTHDHARRSVSDDQLHLTASKSGSEAHADTHQNVRGGIGLRHHRSAEDEGYDSRSFLARLERAEGSNDVDS